MYLIILLCSFLLITNRVQFQEIMLEKQYECLSDQIRLLQEDQDYLKIRRSVEDTLLYWLEDLKLRRVQNLKRETYKLLSPVLFNQKKDKALLFLGILRRRPDFIAAEFVQMITAEKEGEYWQFYYSGNVTFSYGYPDFRRTQYTFEELTEFSMKRIIEDGYFKYNTCDVDHYYVNNKWFADWLREEHQEFLKDRIYSAPPPI